MPRGVHPGVGGGLNREVAARGDPDASAHVVLDLGEPGLGLAELRPDGLASLATVGVAVGSS